MIFMVLNLKISFNGLNLNNCIELIGTSIMQLKTIAFILLVLTSSYLYLTYEPEPTIDTSSMNSFALSQLDVYLSLSEDEKPLFQRAIRFYSYGGVYDSYSEYVDAVIARRESPQDIKFHETAERINGMTGQELLRIYNKENEFQQKVNE